MLEELERRNYAPGTIRSYIRTVEHFARHFHRPPDQLGPEHIRQYQAAMFREWKLAQNTVSQRCVSSRPWHLQDHPNHHLPPPQDHTYPRSPRSRPTHSARNDNSTFRITRHNPIENT